MAYNHASYMRARKLELEALGLCNKCGKDEPAPGRKLCAGCALKNRRAVRAATERQSNP